jgi:hypothetical protein
VLQLERELRDEEIVIFARCHFPFGTLVVTPSGSSFCYRTAEWT